MALFVKREDLSSARYGGNKVRALEPILGLATAGGARSLVTFGPYGSNHVLAVALHGQAAGLPLRAHLTPRAVAREPARNLLRTSAAGAELVAHPLGATIAWPYLSERLSKGAVFVPPGGSSSEGALGAVQAGLELGTQLGERGMGPVTVYAAWGTGNTASGLAVGLGLAGREDTVVAVRVVPRAAANRLLFALSMRRATSAVARVLGEVPRPVAVRLEHRACGPGYGLPTPACERAARALAACGVPADGAYVAKTAAALVADARDGVLRGPAVLWASWAGPVAALAPSELAAARERLCPVLRRWADAALAAPEVP